MASFDEIVQDTTGMNSTCLPYLCYRRPPAIETWKFFQHCTTRSINALLAWYTNAIIDHHRLAVEVRILLEKVINGHTILLGNLPTSIALFNRIRHSTLRAIRDRDAFFGRSLAAQEPAEQDQGQNDEHEEVKKGLHLGEPRQLRLLLRACHEEGLGLLSFGTRFADFGEVAVLIAWCTLPVASIGVAERVDLAVSIIADSLHALWETLFVGVIA
ncbi:hypothetical protein HG530_013236 [Fusarium avenaceum]|nr:hypothetical protein HG530_013236 [Fusarium avenaceum]